MCVCVSVRGYCECEGSCVSVRVRGCGYVRGHLRSQRALPRLGVSLATRRKAFGIGSHSVDNGGFDTPTFWGSRDHTTS